jgi:hypothetical protein
LILNKYLLIFNNGVNPSSQGYLQYLGDIKRVSSIAVEPSIWVQTIAVALMFLIFLKIQRTFLFGRKLDSLVILLFLSGFIISTSASALISFIGFLFVLFFYLLKKNRSVLSWIVYFFIFLSMVTLTLFLTYGLVIEKIQSYSFFERTYTIIVSWNYFLNSPLFGYGWGVVTSHDLLIRILSNAGIVGLLAMFLFVNIIIKKNASSLRMLNYKEVAFSKSLVYSFFVLIIVFLFTGFPYYFGYFWFIISLIHGVGREKYIGRNEYG